jgi:hypothetical protein
MEHKKNLLFIILTGIFVTNALMAEMIGVKIFSAGALPVGGTVGRTWATRRLLRYTVRIVARGDSGLHVRGKILA